ncbi:TraR/DksA family transcriptional regulator [Halalkalibaculum sp. DA3122]|uniref:TraR/DksA family transcriptional regulator n=1 Tax=unclassified Halalkalibaculum TaxID=2964617 RepID=UPI003754F681
MNSKEQQEMKQVILEKIEETEEEIKQLKELTKPVKPDNAYGRLSRMDAINNKSINDAALREQKSRLQKLERALDKLEEGNYGNCVKCGDPIPLGRLKFMPWTAKCVNCA